MNTQFYAYYRYGHLAMDCAMDEKEMGKGEKGEKGEK